MCAVAVSTRQQAAQAMLIEPINHPVDLVDLHRCNPRRYPHLLQSTANGRYDILFACPGESLSLAADGTLAGRIPAGYSGSSFLDAFDEWWRQDSIAVSSESALPFSGGWFVYLGYELAGQIEPVLQLPESDTVLPVALATRFRAAVIRDNVRQQLFAVAETGQSSAIAVIKDDIDSLVQVEPEQLQVPGVIRVREDDPRAYIEAIAQIHRYIHEGDVFQVNLSRRWKITLDGNASPAALFSKLSQHNPAPFAGLATWNGVSIISSSPERLVRVRNGVVETRPIAGTRPRGTVAASDKAYSAELLAHPKERAEHIMLIDLERNDLGRLCIPGTVEVNELMALESYAHVHHIVSNVRGRLRENISPGDVIRAVFPGGTITGCPKVRCMEIIAELEQRPRGAYTGSMGYINRDGSMDLNILIRSMVCLGRQLELRAGAGIVFDSDAGAELEETRAKARGLLHALGLVNA